jgi:hypothetical protein
MRHASRAIACRVAFLLAVVLAFPVFAGKTDLPIVKILATGGTIAGVAPSRTDAAYKPSQLSVDVDTGRGRDPADVSRLLVVQLPVPRVRVVAQKVDFLVIRADFEVPVIGIEPSVEDLDDLELPLFAEETPGFLLASVPGVAFHSYTRIAADHAGPLCLDGCRCSVRRVIEGRVAS